MKLLNGLFLQAVQWIYENTDVKDQKTLASYTGITETTISRIMNDKVKKPSKETLMKLNDAFGGIFNLAYFSGASVGLLNTDADYFKAHPEKIPSHKSTIQVPSGSGGPIPPWADSLIHLVSDNTKAIEALVKENATLRLELQRLRNNIAALTALNHNPISYQQDEVPIPIAAELSTINQ